MTDSHGNRNRWTPRPKVAAFILLAMAAAYTAFLSVKWPFTPGRIQKSFARATKSDVRFTRLEPHFFPAPGCTLYGFSVSRAGQPVASAGAVTVLSSWLYLLGFQHRVRILKARDLKVRIPDDLPPGQTTDEKPENSTVDQLIADGGVMEIRKGSRYVFDRLRLHNVGRGKQIALSTRMTIPEPPGHLAVVASIGPIQAGAPWATALRGSFEFSDGKLDNFEGVRGTVNGKGRFEGPLTAVSVDGTAAATRFEVNRSGHAVELRTGFRATVNGATGDVLLGSVAAEFLSSRLEVKGDISSRAGEPGKFVTLTFNGDRTRIEDWLELLTASRAPALRGSMSMYARVELPPGEQPFLKRVRLRGRFGIQDGVWRVPMQARINKLSARARGDREQKEEGAPASHVVTDLTGRVALRNGVASLSDASFRVPGATATGGGTYNVITKRVDLHGTVTMQANLSEATTGMKSVVLKPFNFLFRRDGDKRGATLPVSVTGVYPRPAYHIGLTGRSRQESGPQSGSR